MRVCYRRHMRPDTDVVHVDIRAEIHLRTEDGIDRFTTMTRLLGMESDTARAAFIKMNPRTVSRAREGVIGEEFIAASLSALRRHQPRLAKFGVEPTFDELFVVIDVPVGDEAAA